MAGQEATPARLAPHGLRLLAFAVDLFSVAVVAAVAALLGKLVGLGGVRVFVVVLALAFVTELGASVWLTGGRPLGRQCAA